MIDNLSSGHQREPHAEAKQPACICDVGDPRYLLVPEELLNVGVLDEGVEKDEVIFGVLVDLIRQVARHFLSTDELLTGEEKQVYYCSL